MASKGKFERATGQQVTIVKDLLKNSRDFRGFYFVFIFYVTLEIINIYMLCYC